MKKLLTSILAGILSLGSVNSTQSQENLTPAQLYTGGLGQFVRSNSIDAYLDKENIDYILDMDITSVLYAFIKNQRCLKTITGNISDKIIGKNFIEYNDEESNMIRGTLSDSANKDSKGLFFEGYFSDTPKYRYSIKGYYKIPQTFKNMKNIIFQGTVANKPISYTVNKNGELPIDASGEWGDLEFKVAYTPSTNVKWLVDHADVALYKLGTKELLAKYRIDYQQGERKVSEGIAIGYKGFTVTKQ